MQNLIQLSLLTISISACSETNWAPPATRPERTSTPEMVPTSGDDTAPWADKDEVLLVLSGGYQSCGEYGPLAMDSNFPFSLLIKELTDRNENLKPQVLVTCLGDEAPPSGLAYFHVNSSRDLYWTTSGYLHEAINDLSPRDMPIYLIGHSYGGWLAMLNTVRLEEQYDRSVAALFTIDPISPYGCDDNAFYHLFGGGFDTMFNFATGGMFGSWFTDGCREAPRDMPANLSYRTDHYNFYQRNGGYLQSGPMYGAYNMGIPGESHTSIAYSGAVWATIGAAISADLGLE